MNEYQHVACRAVDRPVDETNLDYMRRQSTQGRQSHAKAPEHDASLGYPQCEAKYLSRPIELLSLMPVTPATAFSFARPLRPFFRDSSLHPAVPVVPMNRSNSDGPSDNHLKSPTDSPHFTNARSSPETAAD